MNEINHKQSVLRQFIGDNYRPLLETPPVLHEIQSTVENGQQMLKQIDSFCHNFSSSSSFQVTPKSPFSISSQLYLESLKSLRANQFVMALEKANEASEVLLRCNQKNLSLYSTLKFSVDALPNRIFAAVQTFLIAYDTNLTTDEVIFIV